MQVLKNVSVILGLSVIFYIFGHLKKDFSNLILQTNKKLMIFILKFLILILKIQIIQQLTVAFLSQEYHLN